MKRVLGSLLSSLILVAFTSSAYAHPYEREHKHHKEEKREIKFEMKKHFPIVIKPMHIVFRKGCNKR